MKVYVGRWDLLPEEWEGINGLYEKPKQDIKKEVEREKAVYLKEHGLEDFYIDSYTLEEFEETFNADNNSALHGSTYWIKIF